MRKLILTVLLAVPSLVWADGYDRYGGVHGAESQKIISTVVRATLVNLPISLTSNKSKTMDKLVALQKGISVLRGATKQSKHVALMVSMPNLSVQSDSKILKSYSNDSSAQGSISVPIGQNQNLFSGVMELHSFLKSLSLPDGVGLRIGTPALTVDNPDQHRTALLKKLNTELVNLKKVFGNQVEAEVSGLHNPVVVKPLDEEQVTVSLDYQLSIRVR